LKRFNSELDFESQLIGYKNLMNKQNKEESDKIKKKLEISSGLSTAEIDIYDINEKIRLSSVTAKFGCIVSDLKVKTGDFVTKGQELFRIYDPGNLRLEIKILESDIENLRIGENAVIRPIGNQINEYKAVISEINPTVDDNGLVIVRLKILRPIKNDRRLFPGMNCNALIYSPTVSTILIPREAIVYRSSKPVVFSIEKGIAKWNYVSLGRDNGKNIEITAGLKEGQIIAIKNNLQLSNEVSVKINHMNFNGSN